MAVVILVNMAKKDLKNRYRLIDHTADLGMEIIGADAKELFETAALALFDLIFDSTALVGTDIYDIEVEGEDWADLMVNWLRELLYMFNGRDQLIIRIEILSIQETCLQARVKSMDYHHGSHEIRNEIKAVTYHQIAVQQTKEGWFARVIFDV